ncbi:YjbQ family protein [Sphingomonas antarctica]|uniref:secondary thiamine-phosphate synthase enzyme YjbQ n=1 Tax=Sphingomonas antarctica TaxID=2040274 RepID=UPI0039E94BE8
MHQAVTELTIATPGQGLHDFTRTVIDWVAAQGVTTGLLTLFVRHTSCSLLIQENAAPAARRDVERYFARIAPEDRTSPHEGEVDSRSARAGEGLYEHDDEGPDDMPAHLRAALTATSLSVPVIGGALALGTWQGIYLFEHRRAPHRRRVAVHLMGE